MYIHAQGYENWARNVNQVKQLEEETGISNNRTNGRSNTNNKHNNMFQEYYRARNAITQKCWCIINELIKNISDK